MSNETATDKRAEMIRGIRDMADWLEAHPSFPCPDFTQTCSHFRGPDAVQRYKDALDILRPHRVVDSDNIIRDVKAQRVFCEDVSIGIYIDRRTLTPNAPTTPPLPDWLKPVGEGVGV